jgi:Holliday junction resolvasome RuvABC DNA-binding subunit
VVELRDKLNKGSKGIIPTAGMAHNTIWNDALDALSALGIQRAQADLVMKKIQPGLPENPSVEDIIKQVLKSL